MSFACTAIRGKGEPAQLFVQFYFLWDFVTILTIVLDSMGTKDLPAAKASVSHANSAICITLKAFTRNRSNPHP